MTDKEKLEILKERLDKKINNYRQKEERGIVNPLKMGRWYGIEIYQDDLSELDVEGFCLVRKDESVKEIYVSKILPQREKRKLIAYGVLILLMIPDSVKFEKNTIIKKFGNDDQFITNSEFDELYKNYASELLMPCESFEKEQNRVSKFLVGNEVEGHLSTLYDVPRGMVRERINQING